MILAQCLIHQGLLFLAGMTTTLLLQIFSDRLTRKFGYHESNGPRLLQRKDEILVQQECGEKWMICISVDYVNWIPFKKKNLGEYKSFLVGPLIPLFWTSGDISSLFQRVSSLILGGGIHDTHSLRFTSGVTPADLLVASLEAELFSTTYLSAGIGGAHNWDLSCCHSQCETR